MFLFEVSFNLVYTSKIFVYMYLVVLTLRLCKFVTLTLGTQLKTQIQALFPFTYTYSPIHTNMCRKLMCNSTYSAFLLASCGDKETAVVAVAAETTSHMVVASSVNVFLFFNV